MQATRLSITKIYHGKKSTIKNVWLDQNGYEMKNLRIFSSCPPPRAVNLM